MSIWITNTFDTRSSVLVGYAKNITRWDVSDVINENRIFNDSLDSFGGHMIFS